MKIAALQLSTLPLSNQKIDEYLKRCSEDGANIAVLGEYVINSFFKELVKMPKYMIKEQSKHKVEALKELAKSYNLIIIAPIIVVDDEKIYKVIGKFSPQKDEYIRQEFLIDFDHWNERLYFDNIESSIVEPMIFSLNGYKFGVINGFEIHFDLVWSRFAKEMVDVVLIPSVSTFGSNQRWNEILKTRAFLYNIYILRVNRVGKYDDNEGSLWKFYGNTYLVNPDGQIESTLGEKEESMVVEINRKEIDNARENWGFIKQLERRGVI